MSVCTCVRVCVWVPSWNAFTVCMQTVPECIQNVPECIQNVPECSRMHAECSRRHAEYSRMHAESSRMFQNACRMFQIVTECMQKCCMQHYLSGLSQMEFQVDNRHTCRRTCRAVTSQLKILGLGLALGNGNRVPLVPGDDSTYNLMLISAWNCSTIGLVPR